MAVAPWPDVPAGSLVIAVEIDRPRHRGACAPSLSATLPGEFGVRGRGFLYSGFPSLGTVLCFFEVVEEKLMLQ